MSSCCSWNEDKILNMFIKFWKVGSLHPLNLCSPLMPVLARLVFQYQYSLFPAPRILNFFFFFCLEHSLFLFISFCLFLPCSHLLNHSWDLCYRPVLWRSFSLVALFFQVTPLQFTFICLSHKIGGLWLWEYIYAHYCISSPRRLPRS